VKGQMGPLASGDMIQNSDGLDVVSAVVRMQLRLVKEKCFRGQKHLLEAFGQ